jgi:TolA-binding protein
VVDAERRFKVVAATTVPASAPAAELDLARLLVALKRGPEAIAQLEHLILTYPKSALIPEARYLLDEARGAVPAT